MGLYERQCVLNSTKNTPRREKTIRMKVIARVIGEGDAELCGVVSQNYAQWLKFRRRSLRG